jgi:hypothetical protein
MEKWIDAQEVLVMDGRIKVPYSWSAGEVGTRYLEALRDEKKFLGTRCGKCGIVYHVPRMHCPDCFEECSEWVELGSTGDLVTFTVVRRHHAQLSPLETPFAYGIIRLDGATTGFLHLISDFDGVDLDRGSRLEAVFSEEPQGSMNDVKHFRPARGVA